MKKYQKHSQWVYAVYKGDKFITEGTREEICNELNITAKTFYYYRTNFWIHRFKNGKNHKIIIRIN